MDGFDVVAEGAYGDDVGPWLEAGATWWIEGTWTLPEASERAWCIDRLRAGPPRP
jgi:hypothetical protein